MRKIIRFCFSNQLIPYHQDTLKIIQQFQKYNHSHPLNLINFTQKPKSSSSFFSKFMPASAHTPLLQLYFSYLTQKNNNQAHISSQYIEQNLRKKAHQYLLSQKMSIKSSKVKILQQKMLQRTQIQGILIHRKYNLPQNSYTVKQIKPHFFKLIMKQILPSSSIASFQKNIRNYKKHNMKDIYGQSLIDFINNHKITRYLYQMDIDLQLQIEQQSQIKIVGNEGPTSHLVQIQSFFNKVSNIEELYLTDFDRFLKGNSFFP